jgi:hypothetical protein
MANSDKLELVAELGGKLGDDLDPYAMAGLCLSRVGAASADAPTGIRFWQAGQLQLGKAQLIHRRADPGKQPLAT